MTALPIMTRAKITSRQSVQAAKDLNDPAPVTYSLAWLYAKAHLQGKSARRGEREEGFIDTSGLTLGDECIAQLTGLCGQAIFDLFDYSNAQDAFNAQINSINTGLTQATGAINTGLNNATSAYTADLQPYINNTTTANAGTTALGNLLGLNGAAGNASATQQLPEHAPVINLQLDQGTQNALRNQAATGQVSVRGI